MSNTETKPPLKVFLCHSSEDKPAVRVLYQDLRKDKFDPWLDEEKLIPGQDWDLEIKKAEREADVIIICISKLSSQKEGYIQKEIKFALDIADEKPDSTIYIIPARLESCNLPNKLGRWQWVDLFSRRGYPKLKKALQTRQETINKENFSTETISIDRGSRQDIFYKQAQNQASLSGNLFSFLVFLGLTLLYFSITFYIFSTINLIEMPKILTKLDYGIILLISNFLSQAAALFFIFETYGISKLTGFRYRVSSMKLHRIMAWLVIILGSINLISMSLLGLDASILSSLSLSEKVAGLFLLIYSLTPIINIFLTMFIFSYEATLLPYSIIQIISGKKNTT